MQNNKQYASCRKGGLIEQPDDVRKYPVINLVVVLAYKCVNEIL